MAKEPIKKKKKKPPTVNPSVLLITTDDKVTTISFFEHRQDGSKYILRTLVGPDFIRTMKEDHGKDWREVFQKVRIANPDMGTSIMISPPLPAPLTSPSTPDGPSYA